MRAALMPLGLAAALVLLLAPALFPNAFLPTINDPTAVVAAARALVEEHRNDLVKSDHLQLKDQQIPAAIRALSPRRVTVFADCIQVIRLGGGAFGRCQSMLWIAAPGKSPRPSSGRWKEIHPDIFINVGCGGEDE